MSKRTTPQDLADEAAMLRYPRGSAGWDLEVWRIAERKRDEAARRAKRLKAKAKLVPPLEKEEAELAAVHLLKSGAGQVKALHQLFKYHVAEGQPSQPAKPAPQTKSAGIDDALEAGARWRESKKRPRRSSDYTLAEIRKGRMRLYDGAETSQGAGHPGRRT
jgi:hypothetical protein